MVSANKTTPCMINPRRAFPKCTPLITLAHIDSPLCDAHYRCWIFSLHCIPTRGHHLVVLGLFWNCYPEDPSTPDPGPLRSLLRGKGGESSRQSS
jgi:hypothetical protein